MSWPMLSSRSICPGEEIGASRTSSGTARKSGQGIAYLEDGTMIVIENGKRYVGQNIPVVVTSVLQTSAGRMIFAKPEVFDQRCLFAAPALS